MCVEDESKGDDVKFYKHARKREEPNNNPRASGGDFAGRLMNFERRQCIIYNSENVHCCHKISNSPKIKRENVIL